MKSYMASPATIERKWYVVDATGYTLGRLSSEIAKILRGKNKPTFTPHIDTGDYVIVINAENIKVTGKKLDQKVYYRLDNGGMESLNRAQNQAVLHSITGIPQIPGHTSSLSPSTLV